MNSGGWVQAKVAKSVGLTLSNPMADVLAIKMFKTVF